MLEEEQEPLFSIKGTPCFPGTRLRVMMEDSKWYEGVLDGYSKKTGKVRIQADAPHAQHGQALIMDLCATLFETNHVEIEKVGLSLVVLVLSLFGR